jgi:hypothetical protein
MTINAYLDPFQYKAAPTGQETASLLGNLLRIAGGGTIAGATALPTLTPTTVQLNPGDVVSIFDGSSTEQVFVSTTTGAGASSIPLSTPLQYAHAANTPLCSDGASGSLAQAIINASSELETICKQPLLQATYTETYALQSMQASIDSIGTLNVRTTKAPVTVLTSALLTTGAVSGQALSLAKVKFKGQIISVFSVNYGPGYGSSGLCQSTQGDIDVTFTAGFQYAALPPKIKQACIWLVSELLSDRLNPTGAAVDTQGKIHTQYRLLHETKSMLYLRAEEALKEYTVKVY